MTNRTILCLLNHLSHETRNSVHASLGRTVCPSQIPDPAWQICFENSKSGVDRLLRTIDDMRELLSADKPAISSPEGLGEELEEKLDVALCLGEAIAVLNLTLGDRANRLILQSPARPVVGQQHRRALEEALTRILGAILKLGRNGEARVSVAPAAGGGVQFSIVPASSPANSNIASRVCDWLNADPEKVNFETADDVLYGLSTMVAGKRIRALGGFAEVVAAAGAPLALVVSIPWQDIAGDHPAETFFQDQPGLSVLVAEDSDECFLLTGILLEKESVCRARDGLEALALMKARRFDVVLMDVHMPALDGYQAIHSMRDWEAQTGNARTPIVVVSSDDLDTQMRSVQAGCSGFLRKPLDNYELLDLLDRLKASRTFGQLESPYLSGSANTYSALPFNGG